MMEKFLEIGLLYDFYGQMLTDKQRNIVELYYSNDLSLGEISEALDISRQGVYDILKRSEKQLYHYEDKLKLVDKFIKQRDRIKEAYAVLDSMGDSEKTYKIKSILKELLDT